VANPSRRADFFAERAAKLSRHACGLSIGLARRSLKEARRLGDATRGALTNEVDHLADTLAGACTRLVSGVVDGSFRVQPTRLFQIRIELAALANEAVHVELQASGGRRYLRNAGLDFDRRWREAAFLPIVTPSVVQLKTELARHAWNAAA
jgi:hypothetical protein